MTGWSALAAAGQAALRDQAAAWANPQAAQRTCLHRILALAKGSAFAADHGLHPEMDLPDWQAAVPIRNAADYDPWTRRTIAGEANILTTDPVLAFELTGGSAGGRRAIPYTASLLNSFRAPLLAWFGDLLAHAPAIAQGRAYFAVSPALPRPQTRLGPCPVGLPSDLAYFGDDIAAHLAPLLVWHSGMAANDEADWAQITALHLATANDLSLISVWSPTFLSRLLDQIETDPDLPRLLHDGAHGLPPNPARARALDAARQTGLNARTLWPGLALVSAWADAASARPAAALRARLGDIPFQPKGLLATEGLFTLPLFGQPFPLPALTACVLEFEDPSGRIHLADDLRPGQTYALIVTTFGGLHRYRMGDLVTAMGPPPGPYPKLNMLRFAGRTAGCDLVGEKLDEAFVLTCLAATPPSAFLAPFATGYDLWLDPAEASDNPQEYLTLLECALRHNPQYDYARRLGQLAAPRLRPCPGLLARYTRHRLALGHRLSDIKPPALLAHGPLHPDHWATDHRKDVTCASP